LIGSGIMISGEHQYEGHSIATVASGVMTLATGPRFIQTGKFMPAGLVAALGAISTAYHAKKAFDWTP